jgi:hypothetical protein
MSATLAGTLICDYIIYRAHSIDPSSIFNTSSTLQIAQSIVVNTYTKDDSVLSHRNID